MDKLKQAREERSTLIADMNSLIKKAEIEGRNFSDEEKGNFDKWDARADELQGEIARLEKMEARAKEALEAEARAKAEQAKVEGRSEKVEVTANNLKTKEARNAKIFKLVSSSFNGNSEEAREAAKSLREGGWYDDRIEERAFTTLTDDKGGILIPSSVSSEIFDIAQSYGVIPRLAMNLGNIIQNEVKVPQVLGRPAFSAVNQRSAISGSGFNLGGIALKAHKWGAIVDWTNEVDESVGAKLMPILFNKIAEAQAYLMDNVVFNADGTSAYNGIQGFEALEGTVNYVQRTTAASGNNSFATVDATDYNSVIYDVTPGARSGSVFVMHPNMIEHLHNLKDGQGEYIYGKPSEVRPAGSLWGYPIELSEAAPITDGTNVTVAYFFNPQYLAFATGRGLTATRLSEGSITDEDGNTVNLATMDAQAIRWTTLFDVVLSTVTRSTAGTAQGAFAVLRTNNS